MGYLLIAIAAAVFLLSPGQASAPLQLEPVDEAVLDPELARVRDAVLAAARRGDFDAIWKHTDARVQATLSADRGIPALKRAWGISKSPQVFLDELSLVLSLGGRLEGTNKDTFVAPSQFADFPNQSLMATHWVVIRADAPVYGAPTAAAAVVSRSSFEVLRTRTIYPRTREGWVQVTLNNGRLAYMSTQDIRHPSESHAEFRKRPSGWTLSGFYKGID